jgi:large subunit ribosomal protein L23
MSADHDVIEHPHVTEKAMDLMEFDNTLQFVVALSADKGDIADAIEESYEEEVASVNTQITMDGEKKATVRFADEDAAENIMSRIGVF